MTRANQRAYNNGNHDPRLLYIIDLGSSRAHYGTPSMDARDDVIPADVSRHWFAAESRLVELEMEVIS